MKSSMRLPGFAARLSAAFALLAAFVLAQGALNWWISDVAGARVVRGRVAADLNAGFADLAATKQRLKAWSLQVILGTAPPAADGDRLSGALLARVAVLRALGREAEALDRAGSGNPSEHPERAADLAVLDSAFLALREAVLRLDAISPVRDPLAAWQALERVFDVAGDRDLGTLLEQAAAREARALAQKRAVADLSLRWLKAVATAATVLIVAAALVLAILMGRALRRPLAEMMSGADAMRRGDLDHRIPPGADDEFGRLATAVNAMAAELSGRRKEEARLRQGLEDEVEERTRHLNAALADLQESEARRRRMFAEVSHELRTPTTAIRGEAEIALRGAGRSPEEYRDALARIEAAARDLGTVIDDLMTLARADAGALALSMERVDLATVAREAATQARPMADLRGVRLAIGGADAPAAVRGDPHRLRQIAGMLVDNAIRYSHPGGTVELSVAAGRGGTAALAVSDAGIGVPDGDAERVFERQFRAANARLHRPDGTGLGLTIARDLALRHGGDIRLEPLSPGTRAILELPLAEPA